MKKTSRLADIALFLSSLVFLTGISYTICDGIYWDSLKTNHIAGRLTGLLWMSWFVFSVTVALISTYSILRTLDSCEEKKGIGVSIVALVIVACVAAIVMPTLGLANPVRYQRIAYSFAYETFSQSNTVPFSLDEYRVEMKGDYNSSDVSVVEICYTLDEQPANWPYPKEFAVLLNFDTGGKSIK